MSITVNHQTNDTSVTSGELVVNESGADVDFRVESDTSEAAEAEAARQVIRDKYAELQDQMDAATTVEELKELLP